MEQTADGLTAGALPTGFWELLVAVVVAALRARDSGVVEHECGLWTA